MTRTDALSDRSRFEIVPLAVEDSQMAAELHAESFTRIWSDGEFQSLLAQRTVSGFIARQIGRQKAAPAGFVLSRLAADEAEILTLAVRRQDRRSGLAWRLMGATIRKLKIDGCRTLFLEVDEQNPAALGLYRKLGFVQVASRPAYYRNGSDPVTSALVLRLDLG